MAAPAWVADTSSLLEVRNLPRARRPAVFASLTALVEAGRLYFPKQVLVELARGQEDEVLRWAKVVSESATSVEPSLDDVVLVLASVADIIDHEKDSGVDEADPYVLALALSLRRKRDDVRVVTDERKDSPRKLSLNTAAGILSLPSVPLAGLLRVERIDAATAGPL